MMEMPRNKASGQEQQLEVVLMALLIADGIC